MKTKKEHTIWESEFFLDVEDWRSDIVSEHPEYVDDEETIRKIMCETNAQYLDDERANLNKKIDQPILIIADLGLWSGRVSGYKEIESGNISDCLYSENPENRWYVDRYGEFRCESHHHDGTNHYWYRAWRKNISENRKSELKNHIYEGIATTEEIKALTKSVGKYISGIYGW